MKQGKLPSNFGESFFDCEVLDDLEEPERQSSSIKQPELKKCLPYASESIKKSQPVQRKHQFHREQDQLPDFWDIEDQQPKKSLDIKMYSPDSVKVRTDLASSEAGRAYQERLIT